MDMRKRSAKKSEVGQIAIEPSSGNVFADLEDASEAELKAFKEEFRKLRERHTAPGEAAEKAHRLVHKPGSH